MWVFKSLVMMVMVMMRLMILIMNASNSDNDKNTDLEYTGDCFKNNVFVQT